MLAYAAVEVPLAVTLIRRGVEFRRVFAAAELAVPLALAAGIGMSAISPLLRDFGASSGGILEFAVGVGMCAGIGYAAARVLARPGALSSVHRRGTVIHDATPGSPATGDLAETPATARQSFHSHPPQHRRASHRARSDEAITLAGIPVAPLDETKHFKLIGTTGTGKSTAIRELLAAALQRGDRAIIADPDGGYLARFKDTSRGDVVLNPFDSESLKWDLFGEINNAYDIDQLARSLLPDQGGPDRSWISYARTFFASVTRQAHEAGPARAIQPARRGRYERASRFPGRYTCPTIPGRAQRPDVRLDPIGHQLRGRISRLHSTTDGRSAVCPALGARRLSGEDYRQR
jgi:hypothetical protein